MRKAFGGFAITGHYQDLGRIKIFLKIVLTTAECGDNIMPIKQIGIIVNGGRHIMTYKNTFKTAKMCMCFSSVFPKVILAVQAFVAILF